MPPLSENQGKPLEKVYVYTVHRLFDYKVLLPTLCLFK